MTDSLVDGSLSMPYLAIVRQLEQSMGVVELSLNSKSNPRSLLDLYPELKNMHPSRPGREPCMNYMRFGSCKFGIQCKFDHPKRVRSTDELLEEEMLNDIRYSADRSDSVRLENVRHTHKAMMYISGVIDRIFEESSKDKKSGQRFVGAGTSYAILEAVYNLFRVQIKTLLEDLEVSWRRYGYVIHMLSVNLPNLGQAVVMAMKHADVEDSVIDGLNNCFEGVRKDLIEMENRSYKNGFKFEHAKENLLRQTEVSILKNAYKHSSAMAAAAPQRLEALNKVKGVLSKIEFFVSKGIELSVDPFGSCANTVGTLKSDLDLIVSCKRGDEVLKSVEEIGIGNDDIMTLFMDALGLEEDADECSDDEDEDSRLFRLKDFRPQARVPVIKFYYKPSNLELDLILFHSNDCALLNTQLIRDYCGTDPRVRPLMFALKRWVSSRGVGDSVNSTLSSYCWMLMMIFYLQQTDRCALIPVSPEDNHTARFLKNLQYKTEEGQEGYKLQPQPTLIEIYDQVMSSVPCDADGCWVDGVMTKSLGDCDPQQGSIALLLLGFFLYYGTEAEEAFGLYDNIASLRLGRVLPKPHVVREWKLCSGDGPTSTSSGADEGVAVLSSVFQTPQKEAGGNKEDTDTILSLSELEQQLRAQTPQKEAGGNKEDIDTVLSLSELEQQLRVQTPQKEAGGNKEDTDTFLSLSELEQQLRATRLVDNNVKEASAVGAERIEETEAEVVVLKRKEKGAGTPSRSPRAIPSTPVPFDYKVTPSKMRELLEKPTANKPKAPGVFPDVLESAKQWQISVEDPFELNHDLGSVVRSVIGQNHIRSELRRSISILSQGLELPGVSAREALEMNLPIDNTSSSTSTPALFDVLCSPNLDVPQLPFLCSLCGQTGHREKQCALFVCHRCGQQGHTVRECKQSPEAETCHYCKQPGHRRKDCPRLKGRGKDSGGDNGGRNSRLWSVSKNSSGGNRSRNRKANK